MRKNVDFSKEYWDIRQKAKTSKKYAKIHEKKVQQSCAFLPLSVQFDGPPCFPHGLNGIFISSSAKIGKNCTIFHQVTIGSNTLLDSANHGSPTIGDNVFIGCGAKIIGNVHIGNNVRIGANCVVVDDIPDNCTVVLEKPRILIKQAQRDNRFVTMGEYRQKVGSD